MAKFVLSFFVLFVFTASVFSENNTPVNVVFTGENSVIYGKFSIPSEESPYLVYQGSTVS